MRQTARVRGECAETPPGDAGIIFILLPPKQLSTDAEKLSPLKVGKAMGYGLRGGIKAERGCSGLKELMKEQVCYQ